MKTTGAAKYHRRAFLQTSIAGGTALLAGPVLATSCRVPFDRTAYDRYVALMNARDTRFAEYYADDIDFGMGIRGKSQVMDFYRSQWLHVTEKLEIDFFCSDATGAAAEVRSELRCIRDFNDTMIFGRALKAGEIQRVRGHIFYALNPQGLITQIKGPPPEVTRPWQSEPA
jgi:hypothetical protein